MPKYFSGPLLCCSVHKHHICLAFLPILRSAPLKCLPDASRPVSHAPYCAHPPSRRRLLGLEDLPSECQLAAGSSSPPSLMDCTNTPLAKISKKPAAMAEGVEDDAMMETPDLLGTTPRQRALIAKYAQPTAMDTDDMQLDVDIDVEDVSKRARERPQILRPQVFDELEKQFGSVTAQFANMEEQRRKAQQPLQQQQQGAAGLSPQQQQQQVGLQQAARMLAAAGPRNTFSPTKPTWRNG